MEAVPTWQGCLHFHIVVTCVRAVIMRLTWLHLAFFGVLFGGIAVNGERYAVFPRQNNSPSPSSSAATTDPSSSATASTGSHKTAQSSNGGSSASASASSSSSNISPSPSQTAGTSLSTSASENTLSPTSALVVTATPIANTTLPLTTNGKEIHTDQDT